MAQTNVKEEARSWLREYQTHKTGAPSRGGQAISPAPQREPRKAPEIIRDLRQQVTDKNLAIARLTVEIQKVQRSLQPVIRMGDIERGGQQRGQVRPYVPVLQKSDERTARAVGLVRAMSAGPSR